MSKSSSAAVKAVVQYGVAVALLAFVLAMNWTRLTELFSRTPDFAVLALVAVVTVAVYSLQYVRWYLLVRALDLPFTLRNAFRLGMVGTFYNTFLPGAIGGDIVKAVFIARGQAGRKAAAVATVVADRLIGLFGLLLFAAVVGGGFWLAGDTQLEKLTVLKDIILVCAVLAGTGAFIYFAIGFLPERRQLRFEQRLKGVPKVGNTLAELWETAIRYRRRPTAVLATVALSAVIHTLMVLAFHFAVRVFAPASPELLGSLPEHCVIAPIGFIAQALIPLPGGLGAGEAVFGGLYRLIRGATGLPTDTETETAAKELLNESVQAVGLAGRLTLRVIEWGIGLICYIAYLRMRDELPTEKETEGAINPDPASLASEGR